MDPQCSYIGEFREHGLLGEGGQASVYLCSKDKQFFAAKVYMPGASKLESFKREAEFLEKLNFKNLINMVSSNAQAKVKLPGKDEVTRPVIILQIAEKGELFDYIAKQGRFQPEIVRSLVKRIIEAIEYLQSVGVTHRDLKPENILFDKDFNLKVSDFGLSTLLQGHDGDGILYTRLGTEGYKPPEMELGEYTGLQADLFAVGVLLFVMYNGSPPFMSTKNGDKIYKFIKEKNFAKFWAMHEKRKPQGFYPDSFKRLLNSFFSAEVDRRPTLESLRDDEWLKGDQAMHNQVVQEMKKRYTRIAASDASKQLIQTTRAELLMNEMEEENKNKCEEECKGEEGKEGEEKKGTKRSVGRTVNFYEINKQQLPVSNKVHQIKIKSNPALAVALLQQYLQFAFTNKNVFLPETCFNPVPLKYNILYDNDDKKIKVDLTFKILDEIESEEPSEQQISIEGQLVQLKDGKFSIEWSTVNGNAFWISCVINELNDELKVLT